MNGNGPLATLLCRSSEHYVDNNGKTGYLYSFEVVPDALHFISVTHDPASVGGTLTLSASAPLPVQVGLRYALDLSPAVQDSGSLDRLSAEDSLIQRLDKR